MGSYNYNYSSCLIFNIASVTFDYTLRLAFNYGEMPGRRFRISQSARYIRLPPFLQAGHLIKNLACVFPQRRVFLYGREPMFVSPSPERAIPSKSTIQIYGHAFPTKQIRARN